MLVYEKKADELRKVFRSAENIPTEEDIQVVFKDAEGQEIELTPTSQLIDDGKGGMKFAITEAEVTAWAGETPVIPQPDPTKPEPPQPVIPGVCRIGEVGYDTLEEAVAAAISGDEIIVLKNCEGAGIGLWKNSPKSITIDLKGFTYKAIGPAVGSSGTQNQALHLEKGNALILKNGTFTAAEMAISNVKMLVQNYCDLVLENVKLVGTTDTGYVMSNNSGKVQIKNSTIDSVSGQTAFDVCWAPKKGYPEGTQVTLDDASVINGAIEFDLWGTDVETEVLSTLTTESNKFDDLMICTTEGYEIVKNENVYKLAKITEVEQ